MQLPLDYLTDNRYYNKEKKEEEKQSLEIYNRKEQKQTCVAMRATVST